MNDNLSKIETRQNQPHGTEAKGFWYEAHGKRVLLCFKTRVHGRKVVVRLKLPDGCRRLESE